VGIPKGCGWFTGIFAVALTADHIMHWSHSGYAIA
jgi:hypothetical protein